MSKHVRSITIEFERMPGLLGALHIEFRLRHRRVHAIVTYPYPLYGIKGDIRVGATVTDCEIERGMRLAVKKALSYRGQYIYKMFRRWMWLAKAAHECRKHTNCIECPFMDDDIRCDSDWMNGKNPQVKIESEFGRVKVRVT